MSSGSDFKNLLSRLSVFQQVGKIKDFFMITTIAFGIVLGFILLFLLPYIIVIAYVILMLPFIIIGWIWEKITE